MAKTITHHHHLKPTDLFASGPVMATGTFMYQLAIPEAYSGKLSCNLWSGGLQANNGFDVIYTKKAVALFIAAPNMLDLLKMAVARIEIANANGDPILSAWLKDAKQTIVQATTI